MVDRGSAAILEWMAALHYHPRRPPGERELDAAVAVGEQRCRVLEARLDLLQQHITETRRLAEAAGIFNAPLPVPPRRAPVGLARRRRPRLAARTALARAALR
jgi:hypothetical protein